MYVSLEDFEQNIGKYMMLAKKVDLFIVDSTQTTVWALRCRRDPLQALLAKTIRDALGTDLCPSLTVNGPFEADISHSKRLRPLRAGIIMNVASHFVAGHNYKKQMEVAA